jgi:C4-dicarboxylate transporter, DctQ subunit
MNFVKMLDRLEEGVIAFLLTAMTLISFVQVVARYGFNYSFTWALELVTFLFAWLIFLGMSYGVRVGGHIGVDALVKSLAPAKARAVAVVAAALCMVYAAIVFYGGWIYVAKMIEIGIVAQDMPIPQWVPRLVLPIGYALLFFRFAQLLYRLLTGKEAHLVGDEVEEALKLRSQDSDLPRKGRE